MHSVEKSLPVLELRNVRKSYQLDSVLVEAVKGISLAIGKGEMVAVVGASGSGKSTTLHLMGALDVPTSGNVLLDGVEITSLPDNELARLRGQKIGFVFQSFFLYPTLTVYENIALPMRIHEFDEGEIRKKVQELVALVGLEDRASHLPAQLSGGERQRVAVARALSTSPSMLLADEPTGNLDSKTGLEIMELLSKLNREGMTVVIVTHTSEWADYAPRIVTLRDGKILSDEKNRKRRNRT
ncbi:MAG: ABC transporter ATP-binding protein [Candidatus Diapherotrites archaeon]